MDTVRAFAAEEREAAEHRSRVAEQRRLTLRSWDYGNLRIDTVVAPMSVLTNALGLLLAVALGGAGSAWRRSWSTFTYYANATRIMFEFNQIYRRLESSLTEAAQFTELLLDPPTVVDPADAGAAAPGRTPSVRFERVTFAHARRRSRCSRASTWTCPAGRKIGLVGRSGGGKTTLTRLLLRLMDIDGGRILIGGQDISPAAPGRPAQPDRLRAAGPGDVPPDAAGQHRVRPAGRHRRRDPPRRARRRTSRSSPTRCRTASTPWSASAASSCPAASGSGSPSPGRSCATRRSCCSTRRPARWTPRARSSSRRRCGG